MRTYLAFLMVAFLFSFLCTGVHADELDRELFLLAGLRNRDKTDKTPFAAVERRKMELLNKYSAPTDQARIYYQLAETYAQADLSGHIDLVRQYAHESLKNDKNPVRRGMLHTYLGSAATLDTANFTFVERRRQAARAYLEGYKELLSYRLPPEPPELPSVDKYRLASEDPADHAAAKKRNEEQMEARRQVEEISKLVSRRDILTRQFVGLYYRPPTEYDDLKRLADDVLQDPQAVEELLSKVLPEANRENERVFKKNIPVTPPHAAAPSTAWFRLLFFLASTLILAFVLFIVLRRRKRPKTLKP